MKKSIRQPENWQDFETLCKKLFGEIWNCPLKIKKNGRLGQPQSGVDVYAIPEGKEKYWGIQCKGKDNYKKSKLTKQEIDIEINNAKSFIPELETFIFCTTALKDSKIEEYIRNKDIENRSNGGFQILLFSWEDIADFIDENRNTYHWYVDNVQFKDKFDVQIDFLGSDSELYVKPKFERVTTTFKVKQHSDKTTSPALIFSKIKSSSLFGNNQVSLSWCSFETVIINTGGAVIEDWQLYLYFDENVYNIADDITTDFFYSLLNVEYKTTFVDKKDNLIFFSPLNNKPLIQKYERSFKSYFIPKPNVDKITIKWKLIARDYNKEGSVTFEIKPEYIDTHKTIWVKSKEEEREEIEIAELFDI